MGEKMNKNIKKSRTKYISSVQPRTLDLIEKLVVILLYSFLLVRLLPDELSYLNWHLLLVLVSEGFVVFLLLIRRPTDQISVRISDWFLAFSGSFLSMMIVQGGEAINRDIGMALMLIGLYIHVSAKLSLRRSFGLVAADRGIKAKGIYRMVRHPMYLGYFIVHLGYLLSSPSWWNLIVYFITWLLLAARVYAEERLLRKNIEYRQYSDQVRYRFIPLLF